MIIKVLRDRDKRMKQVLITIIKTGYCKTLSCETCPLNYYQTEVCLTSVKLNGEYSREPIKKAAHIFFIKRFGETSLFEELL